MLRLTLSAPGVDRRRRIVFGADAAADGQREEDLARDGADRARERLAAFERGRDVEDDDLVDAFDVVAPRQLARDRRRGAAPGTGRP